MAEPKTIGGVLLSDIAAGASLAGGAIGALGAISSSQAQANAAEFNAAMAARQAAREQEVAKAESENFERRQRALQAASRARGAASGIDIGSGTSLLVDDAIADEIALGTQIIRAGGQARASSLDAQARLQRSRAGSARTGGFFRAGSTLLTGFGSTFD